MNAVHNYHLYGGDALIQMQIAEWDKGFFTYFKNDLPPAQALTFNEGKVTESGGITTLPFSQIKYKTAVCLLLYLWDSWRIQEN